MLQSAQGNADPLLERHLSRFPPPRNFLSITVAGLCPLSRTFTPCLASSTLINDFRFTPVTMILYPLYSLSTLITALSNPIVLGLRATKLLCSEIGTKKIRLIHCLMTPRRTHPW